MRPATHLLIAVAVLAAGPAPAEGTCPQEGGAAAQITGVEARLELRLADGRLVRLAGVDPAMPTPDAPDLDEALRRRLATRIEGKAATVLVLARAPDRWSRWPALVFTDQAADNGGLASIVIGDGLGRYRAEPVARGCRDAWLAQERKARAAKLGLWTDPYYGVLSVDDHAAFVERSGTTVLAEGQLRAIEPSPYRTTLRFVAPGSHGTGYFGGRMLVATVVPRVMKSFKAEHLDLDALVGRRLRFRGLLDMRFGPRIELAGPDDVEVVDSGAAAAAPPH